MKFDDASKRFWIQFLIIGFVIAQLAWFLTPRFGDRPSPRFLHAIESTMSSPKSVQDAAITKALDEDAAEKSRLVIVAFVLVGSIDVTLVHFFWNYGARKPTA